MGIMVAGIDCGAKTTKAAVLSDDRIAGLASTPSGLDAEASAKAALNAALDQAGLAQSDLQAIVTTGVGRVAVAWANGQVSEVTADARGAVYLSRAARTILDIGAEEARAIRCDDRGRALDFALNEKCAAGTGAFLEAMARALGVSVVRLSSLSLESNGPVTMNAQCAVFAESEVVSLVHANTPLPDIAHAIFAAIANRAAALARRVGVEPELVLVGGLANHEGFVAALDNALAEVGCLVPVATPVYAGAIGAALEAAGQGQHHAS